MGGFTVLDGATYYVIRDFDAMDPFFMSIVSDSDHWMFLSSNGSLTAGRRNSGHSLFPYYTEDKIHDLAEVTGPKTLIRVEREDGTRALWEPFSDRLRGLHRVRRNLYKGEFGNQVVFEEINEDLGLAFRYRWSYSEDFGFVRDSRLENLSRRILRVEILDGLQNLLPAGVHPDFQNMFSNLGNAYKKSELEPGCNLGIYSFSSIPGDKAEPMESLRANTCFAFGLASPTVLLSSRQLDAFRAGRTLKTETDIRGSRGAYFLHAALELEPESQETWSLVADVDKTSSEVADLARKLSPALVPASELAAQVEADIARGTARLKRIVGSADGLQKTRDDLGATHHFANCMFNVMRGGVFQEGYAIDRQDLLAVIRHFNRPAYADHAAWLEGLPPVLALPELEARIATLGDARIERIVREYLPLSFSRRHGDPSRPWNIFNIELKDARGRRILAYQGNWRDIFQNWEALGLSYPEYAEGFICKFLNTTTADGYNPYRIGKLGFDWEKPHPGEPWANIGYWGDHQLIYLLRLMEWSRKFHPGRLEGFLHRESFVYADVPYDIRPYEDLVRDPKATIEYSAARDKAIKDRTARLGMDGQYVPDAQGGIHAVNLAEKLLVPLLAKLSNFIPGAGIWLNTQRPEWNDANNALAGFGLSMVTLYHARRYAAFLKALVESSDQGSFKFSEEVATWFGRSLEALETFAKAYLDTAQRPHARGLVEPLGKAAADYRAALYANAFTGRKAPVEPKAMIRFLDLVLRFADAAVKDNRRSDGLYHSYNVFDPATMEVRTLYEMLEGQVAVLSSGSLDPKEAIAVLEALRKSRMYRADQHSYLLYPDRDLPRFLARNVLPQDAATRIPLLAKLVADGDVSLVEKDSEGRLHFAGDLKNEGDVRAALQKLAAAGYAESVARDRESLLALYEEVFDHRSFTGRSGTFFGYEGLGSIYWHMVSKLLLAVQENYFAAVDGAQTAYAARLKAIYYDVRAGIGFNKSPGVYGAFPADPYSHTPAGAGAKQPGMTGQVKEEVITRLGELGVRMQDGAITLQPVLLRAEEFVDQAVDFEYATLAGGFETLRLAPGSLGFSLCQVPVAYHLSSAPRIDITFADGRVESGDRLELARNIVRDIYARTGKVKRIDVHFPRSTFQ